MAKRERLVVIDAHALIHRAYHAIPPLTTKEGEIVNAVYGFTMILLNVLRELKPKYVTVAFDLPGKTKRHEHYEDYKANRGTAPDDLKSQIGRVREVVGAFNIPIYQKVGYEADDVIGTIVKKAPETVESYIVTGDMDELQLVDKKTKVYTMRRGFTDTVIYDEAAVRERYHLTPIQFVDYKALRGDPSDNIPGVAGIGEKTATDLIGEYGSLDNVYKNIEKIKPVIAKKLEAGQEMAYLSQKLSQIHLNLPLKLDLPKCVLADYDRAIVFSLFKKLGFKSLLARLPEQPDQVSVFDEPKNIKKGGSRGHIRHAKYHLINDEKGLLGLVSRLQKQKVISFDTETDSLSEMDANLVGLSFSFTEGDASYIPVGHQNGKQLAKKTVLSAIKPILESEKIGKVGHNIKYDYIVMKNQEITLNNIIFDTMIGAYLANPNARAQKLGDLSFSELGLEMVPIEELIGKGKEATTFDQVDIERAKTYACEDADITLRLYQHLSRDLEKMDLRALMRDIEAPLIPVLAEMEYAGIRVDSRKLNENAKLIGKRVSTLEKSIKKRAGTSFNLASPAQLQEVLFGKLKLHEKIDDPRELKKLKNGGYSTSAQELEKLRHTHPIVAEIFVYRELAKLKNTYIDVLPKLVNKRTGRIHTSFNQAITQTGRLSSTNPNLQNIPIRTDEGKKIRASFVADKGSVLLSADYSQIELRVVAHIAHDKEMIKIFKAGRDIHTETAANVYDIVDNKVTSPMRRIAKIINFGIIYGVSAHGLHEQAGITREEGKALIDKYFQIHKAIKVYSDKMVALAHELGYVETLFGRRRYLPEISSSNFIVRGAAERMAVNMPIQGTAADLIKLAMIDIARELPKLSAGSRMLLSVHDELVFEVPEKEAEKVARFVKEKMNKVVALAVPIETSVSWGKNWGEAKG
jgi:DNA polymerase-1